MAEPKVVRRRIRRHIEDEGLSLNVAADVNVVTSTGSTGPATSRQQTTITQSRRTARAAKSEEEK
jgi:hypothetical protein